MLVNRPFKEQIKELETLFAQRQFSSVVGKAELLLALHPAELQLYNIIGMAHFQLRNFDKALDANRRALKVNGRFATAHYNMGVIYGARGDLTRARQAYELALAISPAYPEALNNLANLMRQTGDWPKAIALYQKALKVRPNNLSALINLGFAYASDDQYQRALETAQKVLKQQPQNPQALRLCGNVQAIFGAFDDARSNLEHSLQLDPTNGETHFNLSSLKKFTKGDSQAQHMLALLENSALSVRDRKFLSFALAKAHEDWGDFQRAFDLYCQGNRLRKAEIGYDIETDRQRFERIKSVADYPLTALPTDRRLRQSPIFVVGLPRSGTTLVEQILASHSKILGANELLLANQAVEMFDLLETGVDQARLQKFRKFYLDGLRALGLDSPYIVDKMPLNFRWIGFLFAALPECKVVHVRRDAMATCWSAFKQHFASTGNGFDCDLQDIAAYFGLYRDLMDFWQTIYKDRIITLDYEQLTADPDAEIPELISRLGLNWEESCLAFHQTGRAVNTASLAQVRNKIYRGSSDSWKKFAPFLEDLQRKVETPD